MQQPYLLELDGKLAGRFHAFTGGTAHAEIVTERTGPGMVARKHAGSVRYQDIEMACGTGMSKSFYQWVADSCNGSPEYKHGAVIRLDDQQKPSARLDFQDAFISAVKLPALDTSSSDAAVINVTIKPELTSLTKSGLTTDLGVYTAAAAKKWTVGSFRIQIDGLHNECAHVTRIEPLSVGYKVAEEVIGTGRYRTIRPVAREYSPLVVRLPDTYADGFLKWHEDFVVKGMNSANLAKKGSIEFLAAGSTKAYFVVELDSLGISAIAKSAVGVKTGLSITVEMYCDRMTFQAGASAIL